MLLLALLLALLAGCGKSAAEKQAESSSSGEGTVTCMGDATSKSPGLPAGFPELDGLTYTNIEDKGPTHVVDGWSDESIAGLYTEFKDRLKEAQYKVLFAELEQDRADSEVSYQSKDGKTEGIVALRASCDNGNVSFHITVRPA
ncbi:MAG: hypothetical protein H0X39_19505 [Actinobacteria bacterium]|nr:hypothetical protein [Actinomycetota bacterium]